MLMDLKPSVHFEKEHGGTTLIYLIYFSSERPRNCYTLVD
jgi:hypothetical protein